MRVAVLAAAGGILLPLGLLALGGTVALVTAMLLLLLGALVVRDEIVRLPHRLHHRPHAAP